MVRGVRFRWVAQILLAAALAGVPGFGAELPALARVEPEVLSALGKSADGWTQVIVALKEPSLPAGADREARGAAIRRQGDAALAGIPRDEFAPAYRYRHVPGLAGRATRAGISKLAASPVVSAVGADKLFRIQGFSGAGFIGATSARETYGVTGEGYAVAVLDTGVDSTHPDLADDILPGGWTFLDGGATSHAGAEDDWFHGTAVAGVITGNGTIAPMGIAPRAKILSIKFIKNDNSGTYSDAVAGFDYIISLKLGGDPLYKGLTAINCSFGIAPQSCPCEVSDGANGLVAKIVQTAKDAGMITFAASGNGGVCGSLLTPACTPAAVPVGAIYHEDVGSQSYSGGSFGTGCTDATSAPDQMSCFSNVHPCVGLFAPFFVDSTAIGGGVELFGGTSAATPHAAAVAVLVQEAAGGGLSPDAIVTVLKETSVPIDDRCNQFGTFPRINALAAVTAVAAGQDCNSNGVSDLVETANGSTPDCNGNHIPDSCDIDSASSRDCDGNGIPDECEPDCNHTGIPDACEIAAGSAPDCNGNGIPDACDVIPSTQDFGDGPSVGIGGTTVDLVFAALDGDALPDLAVLTRTSANLIRVHRNDGTGTQVFLGEYVLGGSNVSRLIPADLDSDGRLDLAVPIAGTLISSDQTVAVLRGRGDGTFESAVNFTTGRGPVDAAAGDFDGDGLPDLVTANRKTKDLTVLLNRTPPGGAIAMAPPLSYPLGGMPTVAIAVDLDGDGDLDLISGSLTSKGIDALLGDGRGGFAPAFHLDLDISARALAAGDIDGDGRPDLAALETGSETVSIFLAQDGGFGPRADLDLERIAGISNPSHLILTDMSGDGMPDILAAVPSLDAVSYLRSTGGGRFEAPRLLSLGSFPPSRLAIGDADGDGDLDVEALGPTGFSLIRDDLMPAHSADRDRNGIPDECLPPGAPFRRGDPNGDGEADLSDGIGMLFFLFLGDPEKLPCADAADANDDGELDLSDAVAVLNHLFLGAAPPPEPSSACGFDPTQDGLDCGEYGPCL